MTAAAATVTRANWRIHPHSIWGFQNVRELVPTRAVHAGSAVRVLAEAPIDLGSLVFADQDGLATSWSDFVESTHTDAMLVLHRGRIIYETYRNGMAADRPHLLFSVTKSVVGLLAELLALDGGIDLHQPAARYVPELAGTAFGAARLRDLLDMRDGVTFDESYDNPSADIHRYSAYYWGDQNLGVEAALPDLGLREASPGRFAYRTPVADVIGWALRRATERTLSDLLSTYLWSRIGAEHPAFFLLDPDGNEIAGAGLNATLRDVARLTLLLREPAILPNTILASLLKGGDRAAFAASKQFPSRRGWSYRSFWWVRHQPTSALSALGVFGQRIFYDPGADLIVIRFGSHPVASSAATDPLHDRAFAALAKHLDPETVR